MRNVRVDVIDLHIVQEFLLMQQMVRILLHSWAICPISRSLAAFRVSERITASRKKLRYHPLTLLLA
jgi:hypothetical protein